ncbi:hypothetical protein Tsedi_00108 [Tepidimonas sediminis]|uniref:DUF4276 family protein n=1 Tax=Tepidimonas sediminis TaxID=2588941 RepID=A0A554WUL1_9BURK|nr:DUF4276 family protein [Tepidimonas sediminis]TSE27278.1 hypothetical protein Tsedi_00108 [Tepidimonas sediminis]
MTQIEFLVEEPSAEEALRHVLPRLLRGRARWKLINLGSKYKLLRALPDRLAAYRDRIARGEPLRVVVLVDRDTDDCAALKRQLEDMAKAAALATKTHPDAQGLFHVVNRIAVEELESWFIGDAAALRQAFRSLPTVDVGKGVFRNPDNGGSWEALHRFLKKHGIYKNSYPKIDAARRIAPYLDLQVNRSRSFQVFVEGVEALLI